MTYTAVELNTETWADRTRWTHSVAQLSLRKTQITERCPKKPSTSCSPEKPRPARLTIASTNVMVTKDRAPFCFAASIKELSTGIESLPDKFASRADRHKEKTTMNEIKTLGVAQTVERSLPPDADSVITVDKGRGFIIEHRSLFDFGNGFRRLRRRLVVTASHCLPHAPVMPCYSYQETTYPNLLAPLGKEPSVWADCLFFDPVSDLAILGEPDNQEFGEENEAYARLVDGRKPFTIADPETGEGYMLALDGMSWQPTPLIVHENIWGTGLSTGATLAGQSGSPIVDAKGRAVALVSIGTERPALSAGSSSVMDGPQPILKLQLPSWVLKTVRVTETKKAPKWTESSITS